MVYFNDAFALHDCKWKQLKEYTKVLIEKPPWK